MYQAVSFQQEANAANVMNKDAEARNMMQALCASRGLVEDEMRQVVCIDPDGSYGVARFQFMR